MRTDDTGQDSPSEPVTAKSVDREGMARNAADSRNAYKVEGEALSGARSTGGISTPEGAKHVSPAYKQMSPSPAPKKSYNPMNSNTPDAPKKSTATSKPASKPKTNTTSNPFTALHNALSPYGNKNQKYVSGIPATGMGGRSKPGKPSVGEQISSTVGGVFRGKGLPSRGTASSVAATNAKRMGISVADYNKRLNAKKK